MTDEVRYSLLKGLESDDSDGAEVSLLAERPDPLKLIQKTQTRFLQPYPYPLRCKLKQRVQRF